MFGLFTSEIVLILCTILLFFGSKKLPELAHSLGKAIRAFKDATHNGTGSINQASLD